MMRGAKKEHVGIAPGDVHDTFWRPAAACRNQCHGLTHVASQLALVITLFVAVTTSFIPPCYFRKPQSTPFLINLSEKKAVCLCTYPLELTESLLVFLHFVH